MVIFDSLIFGIPPVKLPLTFQTYSLVIKNALSWWWECIWLPNLMSCDEFWNVEGIFTGDIQKKTNRKCHDFWFQMLKITFNTSSSYDLSFTLDSRNYSETTAIIKCTKSWKSWRWSSYEKDRNKRRWMWRRNFIIFSETLTWFKLSRSSWETLEQSLQPMNCQFKFKRSLRYYVFYMLNTKIMFELCESHCMIQTIHFIKF